MVRLLAAVVLASTVWRGDAVAVQNSALVPDDAGLDKKPLMRRAASSRPGELINMERQSSDMDPEVDCQYSYHLGQPNSNDCTDASDGELPILTRSFCEKAIAAANAAAPAGTVYTAGTSSQDFSMLDDSPYKWDHPRGCFKEENSNAFFYNPEGGMADADDIANWTLAGKGGIPVCKRDRYRNGTISGTSVTCPNHYSKIDTVGTGNTTCMTFALCTTYDFHSDMFTVGEDPPTLSVPLTGNMKQPDDPRPPWAKLYNTMPKGCFIRGNDSYVYYNAPKSSNPTAPASTETPVCITEQWYPGNPGVDNTWYGR